jgi:outer membrane protein OmpA-like peptidoglycan-associated protein
VKLYLLLLVVSAALLAGGCSSTPREYYGVLGDKGAMTVTPRGSGKASSATLDAKNPVVMLDRGSAGSADINTEQLRGRLTKALDAQPLPSKRFTLYFVEGSDTLTLESQVVVKSIFEEIRQRPAPDLIVVGHTDSVGSVAFNDQLSVKRASTVRDQLIKLGISVEDIQATGRGKRELLIPTADQVPEPRNRRVELFVR